MCSPMSKNYQTTETAHDISFAIFRVSRLVRHLKLRKELESSAIDLVKDITLENVDSLMRLVKLSESIGEINNINSDVLYRELNDLSDEIHSAIAELPVSHEDVSLEGVFDREHVDEESEEEQVILNPEDRQEAVYQLIRQFPDDCRMKDLVSEFPNVSERTLRSDIQKLIEEGLVERFGSKSGPFSYLRATDVVDVTDSIVAGSAKTDIKEDSSGEITDSREIADNILIPESVSSHGRVADF